MGTIKVILHCGGSINCACTRYEGGSTVTQENVDTDALSIEELVGSYKELGYLNTATLSYKLPHVSFLEGIKPLSNDKEFLDMISFVEKNGRVVEVFANLLTDPTTECVIRDDQVNNEDIIHDDTEDNEDDENKQISDLEETDHEEDNDLFTANADLNLNNDFNDWFNNEDPSLKSSRQDSILEQWEGDCEEENYGSDELRSLCDSEEDDVQNYPVFNEQLDFGGQIKLCSGMKFTSPAVFRNALKAFHVGNGCDYKFIKNDGQKVSAKCKSDCGWYIYASWSNDKEYFQIKRLDEKHRCGRVYQHSKVDYKWICTQYFDLIKISPDLKAHAIRALVLQQHGLGVSIRRCYRAKQRAVTIIEGEEKKQYHYIRDYCEALIRWNPGTTAKVETDNSVFKRCYICLAACKRGFLQGCRPIIGVDACHLKGRTSGQLMVAIGKDGNENMFPIAYAVVEGETKETWVWFLILLIQDIGPVEEHGWTFISDRQKGLVHAFETVLPGAIHRHCVRHMYNNLSSIHPGKTLKNLMWAAARARTDIRYKEYMTEIMKKSKGAHDWLVNANPKVWSRHTFSSRPKSDMLLNNISESFNSSILEARRKPILFLLETIRRQLMLRIRVKRDGMQVYRGLICPTILKKIENAKVAARNCLVHWGGGSTFEVDFTEKQKFEGDVGNFAGQRVVVDLIAWSCGCKQWDLTGIPCYHACAAILYHRHNPEDYVDDCYGKDAYLKAYGSPINSMPGPEEWPKANGDPVKPPPYRKQPGRPKKHSRRKEPEEIANKKKISKEGTKNRCGNCRESGHNSKKCNKPASHEYTLRREQIKLKRAARASVSHCGSKKKKGISSGSSGIP